MSFHALSRPDVRQLIDRMAAKRDLTLLIGAGASMEAGLPSWPTLIERLLRKVAADLSSLDDDQREEWISRTIEREDLLGAGAVVEVMAGGALDELVPDQLYGGRGPENFAPGPIAHQVARLRSLFGSATEILTTNYDDLIEQALIDAGFRSGDVRSYIRFREPANRAVGAVAVTHLHGLADRRQAPRGIVLTEEHYQRMQRGTSWQERLVTSRLQSSTCLFVGMSLSDPNMVRYLYGYQPDQEVRHAAIFVRQGEPSTGVEVRKALEESTARRWRRCGVEAIFVDHYADAAQLLFEIGHRREVGDNYIPIDKRAEDLIGCIEEGVELNDRERFGKIQVALSSGLHHMLDSLLAPTIESVGLPLDETLALALWLTTKDGRGLIGWAHSDRAHQDPATIEPVEISSDSKWVSVRTICRGTRVELNRDTYASRWKFVRGLPVVMEHPARLPIGCLTISSSKRSEESVLTSMPEEVRATLHHALQVLARDLVQIMVEAGQPRPTGPLSF